MTPLTRKQMVNLCKAVSAGVTLGVFPLEPQLRWKYSMRMTHRDERINPPLNSRGQMEAQPAMGTARKSTIQGWSRNLCTEIPVTLCQGELLWILT